MSKKLKVFLIVLYSVIGVVAIIAAISGIRTSVILNKIDAQEIDKDKMPSVDFIQPGLLTQDGFDYETYFDELDSVGYDSVIIQFTRTEEADLSSTFYYQTNIVEDGLLDTVQVVEVIPEFLKECKDHNFGFYIGLSVEEYSWWALTCYYDKDYMNHCIEVDQYMVKEIWDLLGTISTETGYSDIKDYFKGWYYAYELFSNPIGWENLWVNNVNAVVDTIVETDTDNTRPILFSPFRQIQLGLVTNEYLMWNNFFKKSHLRSGIDIMVPQDSIGKLDDKDYPHTPCTATDYKLVYDYVDNTYNAATKYGIKYWVNCELFRAWKGDSMYLHLGDITRVERQIKNAQRRADKLVTFSASHYFFSQGDQETDDARAVYFNEYKALYNKVKGIE